MSDEIIDHSHTSLKHLNARFDKLGRTIEELEKLAYRYHRLSYEINQIDVMAFQVRQEFEQLRGAQIEAFNRLCDRLAHKAKERGLTEQKLKALLENDIDQ